MVVDYYLIPQGPECKQFTVVHSLAISAVNVSEVLTRAINRTYLSARLSNVSSIFKNLDKMP